MSTRKVLKYAIREKICPREIKKKNQKNHEFVEEEVFSKRNIIIL